MSQTKYFTAEDWKCEPEWWKMTVRSLFYQRCVERLGYGDHDFEHAELMFKKLGMTHVMEPRVRVRNVRLGRMQSAVKSRTPLFRLSYRSFGWLVHESPKLRLRKLQKLNDERKLVTYHRLSILEK